MAENELSSRRLGQIAQAEGEAPADAAPKERAAAPTLITYYSAERPKPAAFIAAVRSAPTPSFSDEDVAESIARLPSNDPTLVRTAALVGSAPEAIRRWLAEAAKASLQHYLPEVWSQASEAAATTLFDRIVQTCADELSAKDRQRRLRAQSLLRLSLSWLMDQRNLGADAALRSLGRIAKSKRRTDADVARLLKRSKVKQLRDLATIAGLFESVIVEEKRGRQEASSRLESVRMRLESLESDLQSMRAELEEGAKARAQLSEEFAASRKELEEMKQLRALDHTQQVAKLRNFMSQRLNQPLSDARDALDFDAPQVEAARQRINMAIRAIAEELGNPHE